MARPLTGEQMAVLAGVSGGAIAKAKHSDDRCTGRRAGTTPSRSGAGSRGARWRRRADRGDVLDLAHEQALLARQRRITLEHEHAIAKGRYVEKARVIESFQRAGMTFRDAMLSVPGGSRRSWRRRPTSATSTGGSRLRSAPSSSGSRIRRRRTAVMLTTFAWSTRPPRASMRSSHADGPAGSRGAPGSAAGRHTLHPADADRLQALLVAVGRACGSSPWTLAELCQLALVDGHQALAGVLADALGVNRSMKAAGASRAASPASSSTTWCSRSSPASAAARARGVLDLNFADAGCIARSGAFLWHLEHGAMFAPARNSTHHLDG